MRKILIAVLVIIVLSALTVDAQSKRKSKKSAKTRTEKVQTTSNDTVSQTEFKAIKHEEVQNEEIIREGAVDIDHYKIVEQQVVVTPEPPKDDEIFSAVEQQAQFNGNVNKWLSSHINYPLDAADKEIQGRVVVQFCVEKDGSISQVSVLKGVAPDIDKEAIRVTKSMPKWIPAKNNGVIVRSWFTMPITFRLAEK